jgi:hypothetical protein
MAGGIEVGDGFVCDEVRREDNGKLILIGVYSSNIVVRELPAALVLSLVMNLKAQVPVDVAMEFRVTLNGEKIRRGKGHVKLPPSGAHWIILPHIVLDKLQSEGVLAFDVQMETQEWKNVCSLPLALAEPSGATAPQQPS